MLRSGKSLKISTSSRVQQDESSTPNGTSLVALLNQEEEEENIRQRKKISVLAKVKQRARKWRLTLNKKRQQTPSGNTNSDLSWQTSFRDDDHHEHEDDAEIFRTPRHEFGREADEQKETDNSIQCVGTTCTMKHGLMSKEHSDTNEGRILPIFLDKASTEAIASETESLGDSIVPATAPHQIAESTDLSSSGTSEEDDEESAEKWAADSPKEMKWDKGVSVKEYLVDKLRPGEEDRALCRVISDAINLNGQGGGGSLVGKLRNTVTSLLLRREESEFDSNPDLGEESDDRKTS